MFKVGDKVQRSDECFRDYMGHEIHRSAEMVDMVGDVVDIIATGPCDPLKIMVHWIADTGIYSWHRDPIHYYEKHLKYHVKPITVNTLGNFPKKDVEEV